MPRRIDGVRGERVLIPFSHGSTVADTTVKLWTVPSGFEGLKITRVWYNNPTGLAADAANTFNIQITDGTNVAANWDTTTGQQGTLTADTPVDLVLSATEANRFISSGEHVTLFLDETGTATLPAGVGMVEGYLI